MRIQHVNSGTKAKWKTKGTILQLTVPGVEPIEIDLNEELQDVAVTVDVSLNSRQGNTIISRQAKQTTKATTFWKK